MKKILIIILVFAMALTGCNVTSSQGSVIEDETSNTGNYEVTNTVEDKDDYSAFFEEGEIHEINIEIAESAFEDILANPLDEEFHEASITLDGVEVNAVGFRTKGNSTLRDVASSESERYSFKIKVNEYVDQDLLGLDEFVLNNMYSDASYLREYISYKAMAENGLDVPLSSFVNVYINGELYGFYLLVESVDDSFLERNFGDNDGNLYRADTGTSLDIVNGEYIENMNQKNGDDESKADLYELMDIINDMPDGEKGDIESVLDVKSALRYIATNTLLENYDSLNGQHLSNYYIYNDQGTFAFIPWDYNMSFGGFGGAGQSTVDIDNPVNGTNESPVLIMNLLEVEEYKEIYYDILEEYVGYFSDFETDVVELADFIRSSVEEDPSKFTTMALFESNVVYQENGATEVASMNSGGQKDGLNNPATGQENTGRPTGPPPTKDDGTNQVPRDNASGQENGMGKDMAAGNQLIGNDVSIINVLLARIENIEEQLSQK